MAGAARNSVARISRFIGSQSLIDTLADFTRLPQFTYLWGMRHSGKTHLLNALSAELDGDGVAHLMLDASALTDGDVLDQLHAQPEVLLGVATGKSRRGLVSLMEGHQMEHMFVTQQCADDHPSKPHPSMVMTALAETGVAPEQAVMIGDTSFDMDMAKAAGVAALGVTWGYHSPASLNAADHIATRVQDLPELVHAVWSDRK